MLVWPVMGPSMLSILTDPLLNLFYPEHCRVCGGFVEKHAFGAACGDCWNSTRLFAASDPLCPKCGIPLDGIASQPASRCGRCDDHHYDAARSAGPYAKALAVSVLSLKRAEHVPGRVRDCLLSALNIFPLPAGFLIVPVPLSRRRKTERGFNQAALLAKIIARSTGQALDLFSLARGQDTAMHRAAMDRKARDASVRNAFTVTRPALISGRSILLVDDLMTSGATASYCAKALKKSGASEVFVLTLARAV